MDSGTAMSPRAFTLFCLMERHHKHGESTAVDTQAEESPMTLPELRACLEEVREHLTESLLGNPGTRKTGPLDHPQLFFNR